MKTKTLDKTSAPTVKEGLAAHKWGIGDILLMSVLVGGLIGLGIWAHSPWYVTVGAALLVIGGFFNIKTSKIYFFFSIGYSLCYLNVAYTNRLYGEIATTCLLILLALITIAKWLFASDIRASTYEINKVGPTFLIVMAVLGAAAFLTYGFVLRHIGSRLPFLSAGTAVVSVCAYILASRRSRLQWPLWLFNNAIYISIWAITMVQASKAGERDSWAESPLVAQSMLYVILNIYGLVNWNRAWRRLTVTREPDDLPE